MSLFTSVTLRSPRDLLVAWIKLERELRKSIVRATDHIDAKIDGGAVGDGVTNDTPALQYAINLAASEGLPLKITRGTYRIADTLSVPSNVRVIAEGRGEVTLQPDNGYDYPALRIDASTNVRLQGMTIQMAAGAAPEGGPNSRGIAIRGDAQNVVCEDVTVDTALRCFDCAGQDGEVAGTCREIAFVRCRGVNSGSFGFNVDETDTLTIDDCSTDNTDLDGIKLRRKTLNVTIRGGIFENAIGGDGMDAFAGGDNFVVDGTIFRNNGINGCTIKSDELNRDEPLVYGYVKRIQVTNVRAYGNVGMGVGVYRHSGFSAPDDPTIPLAHHATITGCVCNNNGLYGMALGGRAITVQGGLCLSNGREGIKMQANCLDVSIVGAQLHGNGTAASGTYDGLWLDGKRITVVGGSILGIEDDTITADADYGVSTPNPAAETRVGILINATAEDVSLINVDIDYCTLANVTSFAAGRVFEQTRTYLSSTPSAADDVPSVGFVRLPHAAGELGLCTWKNSAGNDVKITKIGDQLWIGGSNNSSLLLDSANDTRLRAAGVDKFEVNTTGIGFFNTAPVAQATVVGAKGGNVALTNLLAALAAYGLIVDNTT